GPRKSHRKEKCYAVFRAKSARGRSSTGYTGEIPECFFGERIMLRFKSACLPIYFGKQVRHGTGFGLGFSVRTADTEWDPQARVGEYGWGGAASTHYWVSPKDRVVVVTMEQTMPYTFDTEFAVKRLIYDALVKR